MRPRRSRARSRRRLSSTAAAGYWAHLFAASFLAIVPVVVLFEKIERHLVGGLTASRVK